MDRGLYNDIWQQLSADKNMVLLAGPRQSGKTTFARTIAARDFPDTIYFNWDLPDDKRRLLTDPDFFTRVPRREAASRPLVILDEIHKYRDWKNYLKGAYDAHARDYQFLVTGSGRLEYSRKAGDSLAGRFLKFHLFPLTLAEVCGQRAPFAGFIADPLATPGVADRTAAAAAFATLWECSGFPEPFSKGRKDFWATWSNAYGQQIIHDDLRSLADLRNLDLVETLHALLPDRVGSPLSMNNLAGNLQVAFDTVKSWLLLFDAFYLTFRLPPWAGKVTQALRREKKLYLFNYPVISDAAARLENLVAVELLRAVETWNDRGWGSFALHYVRNRQKQEVDFLLVRDRQPLLLVETKLSDPQPATSLLALQQKLRVPAVQLLHQEVAPAYHRNGDHTVLVTPATGWLPLLP